MLISVIEFLSKNPILMLYPVIYVVGIVIALANWSKYPTAALMSASGLGIKLTLTAMQWLPRAFDSEFLARVTTLPSLLINGLHAGALLLVVFAIFVDRKAQSVNATLHG